MVQIRPLKTADLFTVTGMLKKIAASNISELIVSDVEKEADSKPQDNPVKLGMLVLTTLYDNLVEDLIKWFSSLLNITKEEYMELPAETTLDIIDHLSNSEECKSFFLRASGLFKKTKWSASTISGK